MVNMEMTSASVSVNISDSRSVFSSFCRVVPFRSQGPVSLCSPWTLSIRGLTKCQFWVDIMETAQNPPGETIYPLALYLYFHCISVFLYSHWSLIIHMSPCVSVLQRHPKSPWRTSVLLSVSHPSCIPRSHHSLVNSPKTNNLYKY